MPTPLLLLLLEPPMKRLFSCVVCKSVWSFAGLGAAPLPRSQRPAAQACAAASGP